jgi:hypothetical protein
MTSTIILLLLPLFLLFPEAFASVLAIDYGTDWTKASLMKPGVPFDVLLNKDSKRKLHSSVGWNRDDRLFGSDAFNIVSDRLLLLHRYIVSYFIFFSLRRQPVFLKIRFHR